MKVNQARKQTMEFISNQVNMTECVRGIHKNQDHIITGQGVLVNGEIFDFAVLMDGHGTDFFINHMRKQDWVAIMSADDPWDALYKILETLTIERVARKFGMQSNESSGSTLLMMRAFAGRIETISIGDSQIVIFKNTEYVYGSTPHNRKNPEEAARMEAHPRYSYSKKTQPIPSIRSAKSLQSIPAEYNIFADGTSLAMTQAIGHNGITGYNPEKNIVLFDTDDDAIDVIMGSDGLWEMIIFKQHEVFPPLTEEEQADTVQDRVDLLTMNAAELATKAEIRWRKNWRLYYDIDDFTKIFKKTNFGGIYDDISVVKWSKERIVQVEPRPPETVTTTA